jgi:hypothetical protein
MAAGSALQARNEPPGVRGVGLASESLRGVAGRFRLAEDELDALGVAGGGVMGVFVGFACVGGGEGVRVGHEWADIVVGGVVGLVRKVSE